MPLNLSKYLLLFAFFFSLIIAMSCKKDGDSGKTVIMNVAPKLIAGGPGPPAAPNNPTVVYYLNIEDNTNQKYTLAKGTIQGFDYVEGYQYTIRVKITPIAKPLADGPSNTYSLISVLSKTKVKNL